MASGKKMTKMKVGRQPNLRDNPLSDCRSLGSNCNPSSQSRKMSIGIMVDSPANARSRGTSEQKFMVPNAEAALPSLGNSMQRNCKEKHNVTVGIDRKSKLSEAPQKVSSPWISTRFPKQNTPVTETISGAECGRQNKVHEVKEPPATTSIHLFANQSSEFGKEKNLDEVRYRMEGGKDGTTERLHEFAFATTEEVLSDKVVIENQANKTENRTETLKMKLWEILGTVSSPNDKHSKCHNHEQEASHLTEQVVDQNHDRAVKFRQNSDTIETDSKGSDQTMRRPIVLPIVKKRSRTTVKSCKSKTPSCNKLKHQEGNTFVFEGWPGSTHAAANRVSSMLTRKKSDKRSLDFRRRKISFPDEGDGTGITPNPVGIETPAPGDKPSSLREVPGFHSSPSKHDEGFLRNNDKDDNTGFNQSPEINKTQLPGEFHIPVDLDRQEDIDNSFLERGVDPQSHIESPTFRMKTPVCSLPSSTSKTDRMVNYFSSPEPAEETFVMRDTCSFWKLQTSEEFCDRSNVKPHSSDNDKEIYQSPHMKAATSLAEGVADYDLSASSSQDTSSESSVEVSSPRDTFSPEISAVNKFKAMLHPEKRARTQESYEFNGIRPGESSWTEEILVQNEEDELARAVKLFLSGLEKLKGKITSVSIEKSSEILLSVAESINLQLQNVESKIQMDMVKLLSGGKSRRKFLETRFEEQQEQLKYIHKKFMEEVHQHLQDCRSSLQELEAQEIEFKGIMKKQKSSHRNTLLQAEEAVDMQLTDAQRKIEAIHESGREKMLQLKNVIAMCLK